MSNPSEIGPDGIFRENPMITYTEKKIEAEQLHLRRYIQENYSKIRDVERELENLNLEMKLTSGPKKAALEHMRKKIELATEKIRIAKLKEEQAKKAWEEAAKVVKEEEELKKKLCDDLNHLVQESTNMQMARLEELKRRLEALNPNRGSSENFDSKTVQQQPITSVPPPVNNKSSEHATKSSSNNGDVQLNGHQRPEVKEKKKMVNLGRGKGNNVNITRGRGTGGPGWTGAGFET